MAFFPYAFARSPERTVRRTSCWYVGSAAVIPSSSVFPFGEVIFASTKV